MDTVVFAILITAARLSHVTGDFVLEVQVHAYSNPTHGASAFATGFERDCCDPSNLTVEFCTSICDNIFVFCFREAGRRDTNTNEDGGSNCLYGRNITEVIEQDNDDLVFTVGENFPGGVPNPVVAFRQTWPGSIQLAIQTIDDDRNMTEDDEIDIFFININVTIGLDFSAPITYMGVNGYGQIQLSFRLNCTENYYGPDCATFCVERDDELGHYTCGSDGSIVCRQGYRDPSSFCTICIPAEECSPDGGFCNVPGECICFDGYDGDNCLLGPPVPGGVDETPSEDENSSVPGDDDSQDPVSSGVAAGVVVGGVIIGLLLLTIIILTVIIIYLKCRKSTNTYESTSEDILVVEVPNDEDEPVIMDFEVEPQKDSVTTFTRGGHAYAEEEGLTGLGVPQQAGSDEGAHMSHGEMAQHGALMGAPGIKHQPPSVLKSARENVTCQKIHDAPQNASGLIPGAEVDRKEEPGLTEMTQNVAYVITTHPNDAYGQGQLESNHLASFLNAGIVSIDHRHTHSTVSVHEEGYAIIPVRKSAREQSVFQTIHDAPQNASGLTPGGEADGKEEPGLIEMTQNAAYAITTHPNDAYGQGQSESNHLTSAQNMAPHTHSPLAMDNVDEEGYEYIQ